MPPRGSTREEIIVIRVDSKEPEYVGVCHYCEIDLDDSDKHILIGKDVRVCGACTERYEELMDAMNLTIKYEYE